MALSQPRCVGCWLVNGAEGYFYLSDTPSGLLKFNVLPTGVTLISDNLEKQDAKAFAFPGASGFTISVVVDLPGALDWSKCTIQPREGSVPPGVQVNYTSSNYVWEDTGGNHRVEFKATVQRARSLGTSTPWSIKQDTMWSLLPGNDAAPVDIPEPVFIEAYGIYPQQPVFFTGSGIPLALLRLFVPTSLTAGISTEPQWIEWVANICHGKQDPAATPGTYRQDSTQHWLRYQIWNGAPSFIGEYGHKFNLNSWLLAYAKFCKNSAWLTTVNCFDQAGIVETALSLGMDNKRLSWEVKKPFGYIDSDLVGWGRTNNPFFEADLSLKVVTPVDDPKRTPFRSHVFISISPTETYDRTNAVIVDACAGPIAGTKTYAQYMTDCALRDGLPLLLFSGKNADPMDEHVKGVDGSDGAIEVKTLSKLLHDKYEGVPENITAALDGIEAAFPGDNVPSTFDAAAVISAVIDPILANTDKSLNLVLGKQIAEDLPLVTDTTAGSVTSETQAVGIVENDSELDPTYISFRISVFDAGVISAVAALRARLALLALPLDWQGENKINVKEGPAGITDQRIQIFGNIHLALFVYKNVLVSISGNAVKKWIPAWITAMVNELKAF